MIFDNQRNDIYARAIKQNVDDECVVLDLGSGLGIHGLIAAMSGAKKVYMVDPSPLLEISKKIAADNNLLPRLEFISGRIEDIDLPESIDLIVSVMAGNFLLTENLLPALFHARDKYLKPGGTLIPHLGKMFIAPVEAEFLYHHHVGSWASNILGIDYNAVRNYAVNDLYHDQFDTAALNFLADPQILSALDFRTAVSASCKQEINFETRQTGVCHGWIGWFDLNIGEEILSTAPEAEKTHWSQVFLPLQTPVNLEKGCELSFKLERPEFGDWTWTTSTDTLAQRQSTFLSSPVMPQDLSRQSNNYCPTLTSKGSMVLELLEKFNQNRSTEQIVNWLLEHHPEDFTTAENAEKFVKKLILEYG
ncbi:MAG: class I SAM-dependent methyltransferase [Gammaproteobacteria bacterium]|nr:class I SAM-dependent methyltransferase [Gammaproteobacteria bacterium]